MKYNINIKISYMVVLCLVTMVVGHVDQVGVAFSQVSQEGAEQGLVS